MNLGGGVLLAVKKLVESSAACCISARSCLQKLVAW